MAGAAERRLKYHARAPGSRLQELQSLTGSPVVFTPSWSSDHWANCAGDADCTDTDPCTTDQLDTATGLCSNTAAAGCCAVDTDCASNDSCVTDPCDTSSHVCQHTPIANCSSSTGSD